MKLIIYSKDCQVITTYVHIKKTLKNSCLERGGMRVRAEGHCVSYNTFNTAFEIFTVMKVTKITIEAFLL